MDTPKYVFLWPCLLFTEQPIFTPGLVVFVETPAGYISVIIIKLLSFVIHMFLWPVGCWRLSRKDWPFILRVIHILLVAFWLLCLFFGEAYIGYLVVLLVITKEGLVWKFYFHSGLLCLLLRKSTLVVKMHCGLLSKKKPVNSRGFVSCIVGYYRALLSSCVIHNFCCDLLNVLSIVAKEHISWIVSFYWKTSHWARMVS